MTNPPNQSPSMPQSDRTTFTRFSSEFDGPRQYYVDDGSEVPIKSLEDSVATYKKSYDIEAGTTKGRWFKHDFKAYYDIHTQVAHIKSRRYWTGWLLTVGVCLGHKLTTWLGLTGRQS